ncbi:MAG: hypothetical protein PVH87_24620 [Desulfobacteraceae bacterium]
MRAMDRIQGKVIGFNTIRYQESDIACWENAMQAAIAPRPLDLSEYEGRFVEVSGRLHGDLWEARLEGVVEDEMQEITGEVVGYNIIKGEEGDIYCYRHGMAEAWFMPLNLSEYMGRTISVSGRLHGQSLYKAVITKVTPVPVDMDPEKEARSLNDLLRIRAANREKIEAVNGNLGTALGYKWTNGQRTDHPCVIIFVPQKTLPWLIPDEEKAPPLLEGANGQWCYTDVVTGGKATSLEEIDPLPELSPENQQIIQELKSGRVGLIGGIQLAFYVDGIEDNEHAAVGTAGIAVREKSSGQIGFLTNQHVADAPGRRIYHPWHGYFHIGTTLRTRTHEADQVWYEGEIDESRSYVRCDCAFVGIQNYLRNYVQPGLHAIGETGELRPIDPKTMDIIGQKVISVGRTRGVQRGTIVAYAYEFEDEYYSIYTDLLIIGEDGKAFSWKGDSGKIIVSDDEDHRPIALLWGGWQERLRKGREQENWTYAIDLGKVLKLMGVELLHS